MKRNLLTITAMMLVLILAMSAVSVGADAGFEYTGADGQAITYYDVVTIRSSQKYADKVFPLLLTEDEWESLFTDKLCFERDYGVTYIPRNDYSEDYEYYSPDNTSTGDEATPDYVLIFFTPISTSAMPIDDVLGDYILSNSGIGHPFAYWYGIYLPEKNELYSLTRAYEQNVVEGLDNVFTEVGLGKLMGDMDNDRKLTIKDATYLQKCLAGIEGYPSFGDGDYTDEKLKTKEDYNRDYFVNVKDVTAIQKRLAGLEYM